MLACGLIAALLFSCVLLKKPLFINKFLSDTFYLEGTNIFWGDEKVSRSYVREQHVKDDYRIAYSNKSYIRENGSYYLMKEGAEKCPVTATEEEMPPIIEMFDRKSVVSNYRFSDLKFESRYSTEIPSLPSGNSISAVCEEYSLKTDPNGEKPTLRFYFVDDALFAIRSKDDSRFVFYVDVFE